MYQGDIITALNSLAGLTSVRAKSYWGQCPDPGTLPYVVAFRPSGQRTIHHGGGTQMDTPRIQFDCVASKETAIIMRAAIIDFFNGVRQDLGNTRIYSAIHQGDRDDFDGGPNFYVASCDIIFQIIPLT